MTGFLSSIYGFEGAMAHQVLVQGQQRNFDRRFTPQSPAFWSKDSQQGKIEAGDKIVLPASALDDLRNEIFAGSPILFKITSEISDSESVGPYVHCSVLEFSAPEGTVRFAINIPGGKICIDVAEFVQFFLL